MCSWLRQTSSSVKKSFAIELGFKLSKKKLFHRSTLKRLDQITAFRMSNVKQYGVKYSLRVSWLLWNDARKHDLHFFFVVVTRESERMFFFEESCRQIWQQSLPKHSFECKTSILSAFLKSQIRILNLNLKTFNKQTTKKILFS